MTRSYTSRSGRGSERWRAPARQLAVRGVAQDLAARADHDRRVLRRDAELAQQRLGLGIFLELDPAVRDAVAREELEQAPRVHRVAGADDLPARAEAEQDLPPLQERPQ